MTLDSWPNITDFHARSAIPGRSLRRQAWTDTADWPPEWTEIAVKTYPRRASVPLPPSAKANPLTTLLNRRGSVRTPTEHVLPLATLATLLRYSCGVRGPASATPDVGRRVYPSAGARFPLECYLLACRCEGLARGLYHYNVVHHRLVSLIEVDPRRHIEQTLGFPWITASRAIVILTAAVRRGAVKYADRAYRFALIEAGHVGQNAILVGGALGVPVTPVGGFADEPINRLLATHKDGELTLYTLVLP